MKRNSVLLVGCGDLGIRTGELLSARGWQVHALRRHPENLPAAFAPYRGDYTCPGDLDVAAELAPDFILATFTPAGRTPEGYRRGFAEAAANLLRGLGGHRPRLLVMASSTRVYAESSGGWVDESSPLDRDEPEANAIIEAEKLFLESPLPACIVRFGGIYGLPGGPLINRVRGGEICPPSPVRYSNRIHRDDAAGFLVHLFCTAAEGIPLAPIYTAVDDLPAPRHEVESWLARELGATAPLRETAAVGRAHRRCRNALLHASGYRLIHPDYRSGYRALIAGEC